jgi:hypothetical protein
MLRRLPVVRSHPEERLGVMPTRSCSPGPKPRWLVASGLIDEYRLGIRPVVLGQGQPLFSGLRIPVDLRLISSPPFASGAVAAVYQPA